MYLNKTNFSLSFSRLKNNHAFKSYSSLKLSNEYVLNFLGFRALNFCHLSVGFYCLILISYNF